MNGKTLRIAAAALGLLAPAAAFAPAHAGGGPELGSVTVNRQAVTDASGDLKLAGTYTCFAEGTARIYADVYGWRKGSTATSFEITGVVCDGTVHTWSATARDMAYPVKGRATVWGALQVCDAVGDCPIDLFEGRVNVRPGR